MVWEIPMRDKNALYIETDHIALLMIREPFPAEKLSISQTTALLEQLRNGSCYVDFALWGCYHIGTAKSWRCRGLVVATS